MGRSLVQRNPTECGVSEYDRKPRLGGGVGPLDLSSHDKNTFGSSIVQRSS